MRPLVRTPQPRLADLAFERIAGEIIAGRLAPGETIRDSELADSMGVSRMPVREALQRLERVAIIRNLSGAGLRIDHPESLVACLERLRDAILADDADAAVAAGLGLPEPVGDAVADAQSAAAEARRA